MSEPRTDVGLPPLAPEPHWPLPGSGLVDYELFEAQFGDTPDLAFDMVRSLKQEWAEVSQLLEEDAVRSDLSTAGHAAHRMKGVLGLLGATRGAAVAGSVEAAANRDDVDGAVVAAASFLDLFDPTVSALAEAADRLERSV